MTLSPGDPWGGLMTESTGLSLGGLNNADILAALAWKFGGSHLPTKVKWALIGALSTRSGLVGETVNSLLDSLVGLIPVTEA